MYRSSQWLLTLWSRSVVHSDGRRRCWHLVSSPRLTVDADDARRMTTSAIRVDWAGQDGAVGMSGNKQKNYYYPTSALTVWWTMLGKFRKMCWSRMDFWRFSTLDKILKQWLEWIPSRTLINVWMLQFNEGTKFHFLVPSCYRIDYRCFLKIIII